jgi:hypothetical protein
VGSNPAEEKRVTALYKYKVVNGNFVVTFTVEKVPQILVY